MLLLTILDKSINILLCVKQARNHKIKETIEVFFDWPCG